ncbi:SufS family cysteine desulfurase [Marinobacterium jannaschii]|uniref:SufS family cysteine desulfurase n=1 Tax=Marinobacterium jannaschii TaxID=64970 RepID=UPI00055C841E|nr:SufS family cysteine desulfurase [Marinobacterium jannaschii]
MQSIRRQFPLLSQRVNGQPLVYLDNAATTQKPQAVINAVRDYYRQYNANVHRASHALSAQSTLRFEQARQDVAGFINAVSSREVIWSRGATEAINLVACSWGDSNLKAGDEILLSTLEHHANIVPWQLLAQRTGALIRVIPLLENGDLDLDALQQLLTENTRLVAISHASNALGTINPIKQIVQAAHAVGALVLVDGSQAVPHFAVDVQALDCDFYVFSGHKLFAPTGIGVLWGRQALLEAMPPWQAGGEMIERVSFNGTTFNQLPFKFEAGTPNIAGVIGLGAAVRWLHDQDRQKLEQQEARLLQRAIEGCNTIPGFERIGTAQHQVSLLSFMLQGQHQQDIGLLLDQQGIAVRTGHHCAMPLMESLGIPGTTRASFAFYNTEAEVDRFIEALDQIARSESSGCANPQPRREVSPFIDSPYGRDIRAEALEQQLTAIRDWNSRYREIMMLGKKLPSLPVDLRREEYRVQGCESTAWLVMERTDDGLLHFLADADARIIRGLIALVLAAFNHKSPAQILSFDIDRYFARLDLEKHLSPSRGNGLRAIIEQIRHYATDVTDRDTK